MWRHEIISCYLIGVEIVDEGISARILSPQARQQAEILSASKYLRSSPLKRLVIQLELGKFWSKNVSAVCQIVAIYHVNAFFWLTNHRRSSLKQFSAKQRQLKVSRATEELQLTGQLNAQFAKFQWWSDAGDVKSNLDATKTSRRD